MTIRIFHANTGSCGGCDAHIMLAISQTPDLEIVTSPLDADIWLVTGVLSSFTRTTLMQLISEMPECPRLVAVGQCAINGAPFGRGGFAEASEFRVSQKLDGCPPSMTDIIAAIRTAR